MLAEQAYLGQLQHFLMQRVAAVASRMDDDATVLQDVFTEFTRQQGLTVRIPAAEGGRFLSEPGFASFRIQLARYSGALSFLQAQHQVAVSWFAKAPEPQRVRPWYRQILQEGRAFGIGFLSPRHTPLQVRQEGTTYLLSGDIPWITGYGFLQEIVTSFPHNGQRHFCLLPFHTCTRAAGHVTYSEPLALVVFNALNTVQAHLEHWPVPQEQIFLSLPVQPAQTPERHNSIYTLAGVSKGFQDLMRSLPNLPAGMQHALQTLERQLDGYIGSIMVAGGSPSHLRAEGARLAQEWGTLARWAYGGKALLREHPVNRLSREAWQYGIAGLRPDDLEAIYPAAPGR